MLILALESSAKAASVALMEDENLIAQYSQCSGLTHSRTLLPMLEDMLKNTEKKIADVDLIAVAHGPGSFTGIRIGVSTLEAMAWHGASSGGLICPVMDARRSQVYNGLFEIDDNAHPKRLTEDRAISLSELAQELRADGREPLLVGDGAKLTYDYLTQAGLACRMAPANLVYQSAWGVGMAALDKKPGNADDLLPVYLRLSQAERERQERLSRKNV